jgi:hypothetical protein
MALDHNTAKTYQLKRTTKNEKLRRLRVLKNMATCLFAILSLCSACSAQESQVRFGTDVPRDVEQIYERGLEWLATNQTPEGIWQGGDSGPGITGMCIMAFLASGEDPNFGRYSENIRRAVRSMIKGQTEATGFFGGNMGHSSMYHHGFAMLGMSEVYGVLDEEKNAPADPTPENIRKVMDVSEFAESFFQIFTRYVFLLGEAKERIRKLTEWHFKKSGGPSYCSTCKEQDLPCAFENLCPYQILILNLFLCAVTLMNLYFHKLKHRHHL